MTTSESHAPVPIADPRVADAEKRAVEAVLDSGQLACGAVVDKFETEFADFVGTDHAVATANGTTALQTALVGLGIGPGDTVLTTPFTFIATANAIRHVGAEPIFADIDPETYALNPASVRKRISEYDGSVDAIVAVHLYGHPAPLDRLGDIAEVYDVPLIEDCAQAHGATHRDRQVGSVGAAGCFSFYPTKNMTTGEGGMVTTDREDVAERMRKFIDHGRASTYEHVTVGHNFRLSNVAAAIGRVQLERLPDLLAARRANAARLDEALDGLTVDAPAVAEGVEHAYNQYTVRTADREALQGTLADFDVDTGVYYPTPVHEQPAYECVDCSAPSAERAAREVLSVPVHPELSTGQLDRVVTALEAFDRDH